MKIPNFLLLFKIISLIVQLQFICRAISQSDDPSELPISIDEEKKLFTQSEGLSPIRSNK